MCMLHEIIRRDVLYSHPPRNARSPESGQRKSSSGSTSLNGAAAMCTSTATTSNSRTRMGMEMLSATRCVEGPVNCSYFSYHIIPYRTDPKALHVLYGTLMHELNLTEPTTPFCIYCAHYPDRTHRLYLLHLLYPLNLQHRAVGLRSCVCARAYM